ncbi:MAG: DNA internalization-related competence protein ComEC/Rec2 [Acidobacteriota bacterium]
MASRDRPNLTRSGLQSIRLAASFTAGVLAGGDGPGALGAALPAALVPALLAHPEERLDRPPGGPLVSRARRLGAALCSLALGLAAAAWSRAADPVPGLMARWVEHGFRSRATPVTLWGRLRAVEERPERRAWLLLRAERFRLPGRPALETVPSRPITVRLSVPLPPGAPEPPWSAGQRVRVTARVGPPRSFVNPGSFDYAAYLMARGVSLVGTVKSHRLVERLKGDGAWLHGLLPSVRRWIVGRLREACGPERARAASLLAALLVGERQEIPDDLGDALRRAGVYHIIALSGLNVGVVMLLATSLLRLLPLAAHWRRRAAASAVIIYWAVARGSGSISRAALMALLFLGGGALGRAVAPAGTIAVSAVLLLAANPHWAADAGFQLTYGASLGILLLAPRRSPLGARASGPAGGVLRLVLKSVSVSGAAVLGTALISARHFQAMAPAALVSNLAAVPIAGLLLVLGLTTAILMPLCRPAAAGVAMAASGLVRLLFSTCAVVSSAGAAFFYVVPPPSALVISGGAALVAAGALRSRGRRAVIALLVAALAVTALRGRGPEAAGRLEVAALDVGQGDALLVRCPDGATLLVDAGGFTGSRFDVGGRVVGPALRAMGILKVDILAVTHAHRDHLGGAASVLKQFSPDAVWLGRMPEGHPEVEELERLARERGIPVLRPLRGVRLTLGGVRVEVIHPASSAGPRGPVSNSDSLALRIEYGRRAVLLTGDLEAATESELLARERLAADLLKVGHHGSRTSTTAPFLARVGPRLAVISVGASNPWGQPHRAALARLRDRSVRVYRTDLHGAVLFSTDGTQPFRARRLVGDGSR